MKTLTGLIVEDSELTRQHLKKILEYQKCTVQSASSGEDAFNILNQGIQVDFAIVDINLPVMNGVEVIRKLSANKEWKKITVFPYSALWDDQTDIPYTDDLEAVKNWQEIRERTSQSLDTEINPMIGKPHGLENSSMVNPKLVVALARMFKNEGIELLPDFKLLLTQSLHVLEVH